MKAMVITTNCKISIIEVHEPLHKGLQEAIGGYIELVHPKGLRRPFCMLVDEDGLRKKLLPNPLGCLLYETYRHGQPIVGDIAIVREKWSPDGIVFDSLTDDDIRSLTAEYGRICTQVLQALETEGRQQ